MLVEDNVAFVEQLELPRIDKHADKHRRRVSKARIEIFELEADVGSATRILSDLASDGRAGVARDIGTLRALVDAKRQELERKRKSLERLEARSRALEGRGRKIVMFRLHSAQHYVDYSAEQFALLLQAQRAAPTLVTRKDGRRWWWYRDRFWWEDGRLTASQVKSRILENDRVKRLPRQQSRTVLRQSEGEPTRGGGRIPESVKLAVWRRDSGRCVDCGTVGARFDQVEPGRQSQPPTVEEIVVRCESCATLSARMSTPAGNRGALVFLSLGDEPEEPTAPADTLRDGRSTTEEGGRRTHRSEFAHDSDDADVRSSKSHVD